VFNIGFSTYSGTVTAASDWDAPAERKQVRPALPDSYEALLHHVAQQLASTPDNPANFLLPLRDGGQAGDYLRAARLERAIGVIYRPETERQSHYFHARLADQFDAVIHIDTTRAVEPLERTSTWHSADAPETYPTGR
ncbi:MAG TPA: erythromycin esterase family protein, partial [Roseiflexaceae bacterium]|nr:erythromycin esterase family protein [Roseiflexaceae bacterium]